MRSTLAMCASCGGFLPAAATACPHCNAATRPLFERLRLGALGGALGGGAIAFTLMACYGMPPCEDGTRNCYDDTDAGRDGGEGGRDADLPDVTVGTRDASPDALDDSDGGDGG